MKGETVACTIVSNNYLALAKVLAQSFKRFHPDIDTVVLIADKKDPAIPYSLFPFHTVFAEELEIPNFYNFAFKYTILEFNTAVKPFFIEYLHKTLGAKKIIYFDPDILVTSRCEELLNYLEEYEIVLTPHITKPLDNDYVPSERLIRMVGVYNLGFGAFKMTPAVKDFIKWWQKRLYLYCFHDHQHGLFVDQSWADFIPCFIDNVKIMREPNYNVAYWNLTTREISFKENRWYADGLPLRFFHFSGFNVLDTTHISKYQTRIQPHQLHHIRPLLEMYSKLVVESGHAYLRNIKYAFNYFEDTTLFIPPIARRLLAKLDPYGKRWSNPFSLKEKDSFLGYLLKPIKLKQGLINHLLLALWETFPGVTRTFPRIWDEHLPVFKQWVREVGLDMFHINEIFLELTEENSINNKISFLSIEHVQPIDIYVFSNIENILSTVDLTNPLESQVEWLNEKIYAKDNKKYITRLALLLYMGRGDIQQAFPDIFGTDYEGFLKWFIVSGKLEYGLSEKFLHPILEALGDEEFIAQRENIIKETAKKYEIKPIKFLPRLEPVHLTKYSEYISEKVETKGVSIKPQPLTHAPFGINLAGHFILDTGTGVIARSVKNTIKELQFPLSLVPLDIDLLGSDLEGRRLFSDGICYPISILVSNADEIPWVLSNLPASVLVDSYKIAFWAWELAHFPIKFTDRFAKIDEIWTFSNFCKSSFETVSPVPVKTMPVVIPPPKATANRDKLGMEKDRFYFFFAFDIRSVPDRKNPEAAIEAVKKLTKKTQKKVGLFLKITRATENLDRVAEIRKLASDTHVIIYTQPTTREEVETMIASSDAILSLHRSEGLGIIPIEGMMLGKPVIATNYGGVTEYLTSDTGFPVAYKLKSIDRELSPYPKGAVWAEADIDDAVEKMKFVVENSSRSKEIALEGKRFVLEYFGLEKALAIYKKELYAIADKIGVKV